ncbi:MAG: hypothetical protein F4162_01500 [Synechococcus sp. SB0676_bin_10]|uniref:Uncharacterized protein n=1 Tax=Synechococcus sp. SB0676_bin_10 TaxID=2604869 RepID=A0A6B1F303_9SYNE|nr:hypothetical protein [Cyanobacteria bacterium MAG IRC4_bin_6]MYG37700.1 hypothetical protein [Synechococcus sp. SB0676_bin_10]
MKRSLLLEAATALLNREGLNTTAVEGETLDPLMVRPCLARRLQLPPQPDQPSLQPIGSIPDLS